MIVSRTPLRISFAGGGTDIPSFYEKNSYGLAAPIVGKNADFTHFVWIGSPDIKTALSNTKKMLADPAFADFSKKVSGVRKVVNTTMIIRVMDF